VFKYVRSVLFLLISEVGLQAQTFSAPLLPGEIPAPAIHIAESTQNALSLGLSVANDLDDNAFNNDNNKETNLLTLVEPHVGWSLTLPRATWMLNYRPGFTFGHPNSLYDSQSQLLDTNLQFTPIKRLQVRVRESLLQSKNVFDQLEHSEPASASSVLDRPNNSIFATARENMQQAGADVSYALNRRTVIGTSAAFFRVGYASAFVAQSLGSARSVGTHVFSSYRLTRHHWVGFDYSLQDLISQPQSRSLVQSVLYTDTLLLGPTTSVSFFVGPQYSLTRGETGLLFSPNGEPTSAQAKWSWAGGATYVWSSSRTNMTLALARRISDGAGLEGPVQLSSLSLAVKRQLTKHWKSQLSFSDNRNRALISSLAPLSYVSFAGGFARALNQRASIECQYWHVHETGSAAPLSTYLADHNRISLSLHYDFKVPLQR